MLTINTTSEANFIMIQLGIMIVILSYFTILFILIRRVYYGKPYANSLFIFLIILGLSTCVYLLYNPVQFTLVKIQPTQINVF